jgi:putative ABC transport system permease protein
MIEDYFKLAIKNIKKRKLRSSLTVIGIFIAIITIFVLLSLSFGLNDYVNEQFKLLGTDKIIIMPRGQMGAPGTSGAVELTLKDVEVIDRVRGVDKTTYVTIGNAKIEFKGNPRYYMAMGLPLDATTLNLFFESMNVNIDDGRLLKKGDKGKILIGYNYKYRNLFDRPVQVGDKIKINSKEFEVVGVLGAIGNPSDDQQVYISFDDFKELYNSGDRVDMIYAKIKSGENVKTVADRVDKELMKFRNVNEKTKDYDISTPEELMQSFQSILNILTVFLLGIGSISVLVGSIGIANTMYTSVLERNKEIGTMKAIGAKNSNILFIFVIEAGILGLIGGILGITAGIGIAKIIEYIANIYLGTSFLKASMDIRLIIGSLVFAFLIGIISGLTPSYQASKLKPVDALRYE